MVGFENTLGQGLSALGLAPTEEQLEQLCTYARLLIEENRHQNLTAITEPVEVARLHFLDCAALLALAPNLEKRLIDIGTGAGFPGLVLRILRPELSLTLLDSQQKRLTFLESVCRRLELKDVTLLHGRGEVLAHDPGLRESFDLATARAVAPLPLLLELCLPFLRVGGRFLAMKGPQGPEELRAAASALRRLGGDDGALTPYTLPRSEVARCLVTVSKQRATEAAFPRKWARMKKDVL